MMLLYKFTFMFSLLCNFNTVTLYPVTLLHSHIRFTFTYFDSLLIDYSHVIMKTESFISSFPILCLFKNNFIYLFLAMLGLCCCAGFSLFAVSWPTLHCSARASHCGGFSRGARALGHAGFSSLADRLSSCSSWALEHRSRAQVVVQGLSCPMACGI